MSKPRNGGEALPLLLLFALLPCAAGVAALSPAISPAAQPKPSSAPPKSSSAPPKPSSARPLSLDPKQLTALQSMNLPTTRDPCSIPPPRNFTVCDSSSPFRLLVSLTLENCSSDLEISTTALRAFSTSLTTFSLIRCHVPLVRLPPQLSSSLRSFTCSSCFRRLTGVWLSRMPNLTELAVTDSSIMASGPSVILSQMSNLRKLAISRTNLAGFLPHHWHSLNLTSVNLSSNELRGPIHGSIGQLSSLESLNLSSNSLSGVLPPAIANLVSLKNASFANNSLSGEIPQTLVEMTALVHLDLSSNQFNGTVPRFLTEMKNLKFLDLGKNSFHGVLPFNSSFIKRLEVFRIEGNDNLCYNKSLLSSKLKLGIARCDKYGLPVGPPATRAAPADSSEYSDGADDVVSGGGGGGHGPSKVVLGVAIGLSCLVFLIIFIVCVSKLCG